MAFIRKLLKKNEESESFDVELSYIAPRIIIIGSCSEEANKQSCSELKRFLDCFHKGYYKVFDLCEEGCYVSTKFHDKVSRFPISKERPPTLDLIKKFCVSVDNWLISHDNNVVVIFEKKKGRTSVLLASYLVYSALVQDAITALEYYAFQRTGNIKVKASPSKQRYVAYFERMRKLEKMGLKLQSNELRVDKIAIQGLHSAKKLCKLKITDGNRNYEVLVSTD
jgi:phosphatidylinositol-3,4,5-trisphosphate 3-phosphatase/dual-specificity protein phosphatase PTEN